MASPVNNKPGGSFSSLAKPVTRPGAAPGLQSSPPTGGLSPGQGNRVTGGGFKPPPGRRVVTPATKAKRAAARKDPAFRKKRRAAARNAPGFKAKRLAARKTARQNKRKVGSTRVALPSLGALSKSDRSNVK